jgi:peptidoglycan/LPS O-acetylase OafA/YrhL
MAVTTPQISGHRIDGDRVIAEQAGPHLAELDGVRALAILAVLAHHGSYGFVKGGFLGVDLFFVLSGFLITRLLAAEWARHGSIRLSMFYARRALRIVPPLVTALVIAQLLGKFDWRQGAAPILFFYANYIDAQALGTMVHAWSLAVEEQFYLAWPLVFVVAMRYGGNRAGVTVALAAFLAALTFRLYCVSAGMDAEAIYRHGLARSDSLAAGCLIALTGMGHAGDSPAARHTRRIADRIVLVCFVVSFAVLCLVAVHTHPWMLGLGYSLFAIASALFIAALVAEPPQAWSKRLASSAVLTWIGRRSYGIYLFHVPIFVALEPFRERQSVINFVLVTIGRVIATLIVAELSWRLIEAPALRLKRYFYPVRVSSRVGPPTNPDPAGTGRTASSSGG